MEQPQISSPFCGRCFFSPWYFGYKHSRTVWEPAELPESSSGLTPAVTSVTPEV